MDNLDQIAAQANADEALKQEPLERFDDEGNLIQEVDYVAEASGVIEFAAVSLFPIYPALETIYTEKKRAEISQALGRVMEYYGVEMGGLFAHPLAGLLLVTIPVIVPTYRVIKQSNLDDNATQNQPDQGLKPVIDQTVSDSLHTKV